MHRPPPRPDARATAPVALRARPAASARTLLSTWRVARPTRRRGGGARRAGALRKGQRGAARAPRADPRGQRRP
eukprot:4491243-Pyramimonas_sp.AAC.1